MAVSLSLVSDPDVNRIVLCIMDYWVHEQGSIYKTVAYDADPLYPLSNTFNVSYALFTSI